MDDLGCSFTDDRPISFSQDASPSDPSITPGGNLTILTNKHLPSICCPSESPVPSGFFASVTSPREPAMSAPMPCIVEGAPGPAYALFSPCFNRPKAPPPSSSLLGTPSSFLLDTDLKTQDQDVLVPVPKRSHPRRSSELGHRSSIGSLQAGCRSLQDLSKMLTLHDPPSTNAICSEPPRFISYGRRHLSQDCLLSRLGPDQLHLGTEPSTELDSSWRTFSPPHMVEALGLPSAQSIHARPEPYIVASSKLLIESFSLDFLGYTERDLVGLSCLLLFVPFYRKRLEQTLVLTRLGCSKRHEVLLSGKMVCRRSSS